MREANPNIRCTVNNCEYHCKDCDYQKTSYVAAKSVVADYYGIVDGNVIAAARDLAMMLGFDFYEV